MDPQDIRSLQLLEEIDNNHSPSQRDLARRLNISLGLVNSFIKRLAKKGYVKITTIPKNRVRYMLTPKGFAEKTRLTYEFIGYSLHFYKSAMNDLENLLNGFEKGGVRKVIFYGANDLAEIASIALRGRDIDLVGIVDDQKRGEEFLGFKIKSVGESKKIDFDRIIVTSLHSKDAQVDNLVKQRISKEKIVTLG
jgi:DNA-binding MarR family transcriptional regulator